MISVRIPVYVVGRSDQSSILPEICTQLSVSTAESQGSSGTLKRSCLLSFSQSVGAVSRTKVISLVKQPAESYLGIDHFRYQALRKPAATVAFTLQPETPCVFPPNLDTLLEAPLNLVLDANAAKALSIKVYDLTEQDMSELPNLVNCQHSKAVVITVRNKRQPPKRLALIVNALVSELAKLPGQHVKSDDPKVLGHRVLLKG